MKKILIALLLVLLLTLDCFAIFKGINLFGIEVYSISQIKDMNTNLDAKIGQATTLASTDYPKALSNIETNLTKLEKEKKNYISEYPEVAGEMQKYGESAWQVSEYQQYKKKTKFFLDK